MGDRQKVERKMTLFTLKRDRGLKEGAMPRFGTLYLLNPTQRWQTLGRRWLIGGTSR